MIKKLVTLVLVLLLSIESFAAMIDDNDGAAFITKAEFDSLKNDFQSQIDAYNSSINNKIDGAISSYLAGVKIKKTTVRNLLIRNYDKIYSLDLESDENKWKFAYPFVDAAVSQVNKQDSALSGHTLTDRHNVRKNQWSGYSESKYARDAIPGRSLVVKKIDKHKCTAEFEGISNNHYYELYVSNTDIKPVSMSTKRIITKWAYKGPWGGGINWLQLSSCSMGSLIAVVSHSYYYEFPDDHSSSSSFANRDWRLNFIKWHDENLIRQASIIWASKAENKFEALDEDLGFGNEIPDYSNNVPTDTLWTRWSQKSYGNIFKSNADDPADKTLTPFEIDSTWTGSSGNAETYDDAMSGSKMYTDNNVWPGRHFCSDYITNWNQLYQPLWGKSYTNDGSYLKLIDGFPLVTANENEQLEYKIEFDENEEFEIIAKASPFGNTIDESNLLNISSDNQNWGKSCRVVKTGTLYFDFVDKNTLTKNDTVIYIKWHKVNSTNNYNGGGTLNLSTNKSVKVTS